MAIKPHRPCGISKAELARIARPCPEVLLPPCPTKSGPWVNPARTSMMSFSMMNRFTISSK